ncbi:CbtB-domain containing protein [Haloplanus salinus]|uniref:CbtB-domain containing protein n=1 Tax=Haloplanus salinus TaxID=1126245 RepID=A0A368N6S9_9EURY|nr:CbtB domain-containing protein [Haloplanus salinus]RCU45916.1 CbtB-domain containing protein [Haloplanus salinus]
MQTSATTTSVHGRIDRVRSAPTPAQLATGLLFAVALGVTLLFVQGPLVHDSLHTVRHTAGIACH